MFSLFLVRSIFFRIYGLRQCLKTQSTKFKSEYLFASSCCADLDSVRAEGLTAVLWLQIGSLAAAEQGELYQRLKFERGRCSCCIMSSWLMPVSCFSLHKLKPTHTPTPNVRDEIFKATAAQKPNFITLILAEDCQQDIKNNSNCQYSGKWLLSFCRAVKTFVGTHSCCLCRLWIMRLMEGQRQVQSAGSLLRVVFFIHNESMAS